MAWPFPRRPFAVLVAATLASSLTAASAPALAQPAPTPPSPPPGSAPAPATTPPTPPATATATATAGPTGGSAPVKVATSDGKGLIYLDDKLVGEGSFISDIAAGQHKLRITHEGYDTFEEEVTVKAGEPLARTITLKINSKIQTGSVESVDRLEGIYGGFGFLAMFTPGGTHNDVQKLLCDSGGRPADVTQCSAPDGFGGGLSGFVGYHWDPVGIEFFAAGQFDQRTMTVDWKAANTDPGIGPNPARHEDYKLLRAGFMGLFRARLTLQPTSTIRVEFALGAGISRRVLFLQRNTTSPDGKDHDKYESDPAGYWSPIVNFEPSVSYRLTKSVAVTAGLQLFFDTPATFLSGNGKDQNPQSNKESFHQLGSGQITVTTPTGPQTITVPRGLATNPLDLASNLQVFVGPFIGMTFGP